MPEQWPPTKKFFIYFVRTKFIETVSTSRCQRSSARFYVSPRLVGSRIRRASTQIDGKSSTERKFCATKISSLSSAFGRSRLRGTRNGNGTRTHTCADVRWKLFYYYFPWENDCVRLRRKRRNNKIIFFIDEK